MHKIYALIDPRSKSIRYIGLTSSDLKHRLSEHICASKKKHTYVYNWIRSIMKEEVKPEIILVEDNLDKYQAGEAEISYIKHFKNLGCRLTNVSSGGHYANSGNHRRVPLNFKQSEEHKRLKVLNNPRIKKIIQLDLDGNFLAEFESQRSAQRITGINQGNIGAVLTGVRLSAGGFKWKYK